LDGTQHSRWPVGLTEGAWHCTGTYSTAASYAGRATLACT
jgi:hypothetical protein